MSNTGYDVIPQGKGRFGLVVAATESGLGIGLNGTCPSSLLDLYKTN